MTARKVSRTKKPEPRALPAPTVVDSAAHPAPQAGSPSPLSYHGRARGTPSKPEMRRIAKREELWPGSAALHFDRHNRSRDSGFTTIPRSLSIVGAIIQHLSDAGTARVYWDLWCRSYDEGFVEIHDERTLALSAGFKNGTRHVRTWQSRMRELEKLGFIVIRRRATTEYGYALLVHPHFAVAKLRMTGGRAIPQHLLALFDERTQEIGAGHVDVAELEEQLTKARSHPT